jgi:hypothetical protein
MIQFRAKSAIPQTPNESFPYVIRPIRANCHLEIVVVHVQAEIVHPAITKGEI